MLLILPERDHPQFKEEDGRIYHRDRVLQGLNFMFNLKLA